MKGFCWKEVSGDSDDPEVIDESKNLDLSAEYQWRVNDLKPGRKYAVRAFAVNSNGLGYGTTTYLTTNATDLPVVSSCTPSDSTSTSITMLARILGNASTVTEKGFCYSSTKLSVDWFPEIPIISVLMLPVPKERVMVMYFRIRFPEEMWGRALILQKI